MNAPVSSFPSGALADTSAARISYAPVIGRLSLRARGELAPFGQALGIALPLSIGQRASEGETEIIRLGPDEWSIITPVTQRATIEAAFAAIYAEHPHSLVDVSGREVTFAIEGPRAAEILTLGCPRDIATILPGQGRRTVFDGVTVVLWRDTPDSFRMDVWQSFAPHVLALLHTGCRELAAQPL
ncbi:sarcosine oxidase subunit gamma family protein [Ponticoccus alexandrii]|uniref:Sarcosine oxidase subunit gamma family protein n=1 Tax=Ponticoccus alexandrii TaxID=1943633 RepID=A0ABX7FFZ1_9RHOB|nr:sarcosine oxidase subunit gamma family protein [Ponticoccus alexandrii]ETA49637.1 sarcosine oxidase subunit gamma [Rhodobacteraceae bacterium PD-2]QRF68851.1 sarcosine oxidase subunit gamma family protein [Ponticoccus alexandrii]